MPFVAKAVGHPLAKYASLLMAGQTLPELGFTEEPTFDHVAVKEAVLPFEKFPGQLQSACKPGFGLAARMASCQDVAKMFPAAPLIHAWRSSLMLASSHEPLPKSSTTLQTWEESAAQSISKTGQCMWPSYHSVQVLTRCWVLR